MRRTSASCTQPVQLRASQAQSTMADQNSRAVADYPKISALRLGLSFKGLMCNTISNTVLNKLGESRPFFSMNKTV